MRIYLLFLLWLPVTASLAQEISPAFREKMVSFNLDWPKIFAHNQGVKTYLPEPNFDQDFDLGIRVTKENYRVLIFFEEKSEPQIPHIKATLKANHFALNREDTYVSIHTLTKNGLEAYGADWGGVYYFKPKTELSSASEAQLVCLYKTDVGAVYLLYLFDKFSPEVEEMIWNPVFLPDVSVE